MARKFNRFLKPDYLPMGLVLLVIVLLLVYFFTQSKEGMESGTDVLIAHQASTEKTLVLFYADWCGHCQRLEPIWEEASKMSKGRMIQRDVGSKEAKGETAAENQALMDKYKIDGFPTILVFQNGKSVPYEGPRTVEAFLEKLK